jgi:hypothetical protein
MPRTLAEGGVVSRRTNSYYFVFLLPVAKTKPVQRDLDAFWPVERERSVLAKVLPNERFN